MGMLEIQPWQGPQFCPNRQGVGGTVGKTLTPRPPGHARRSGYFRGWLSSSQYIPISETAREKDSNSTGLTM